MTIFVGNLPYEAKEVEIEALFAPKPCSARIIFDKETQRSRGFGFVDFQTDDHAKDVLAAMRAKPLSMGGRTLTFNEANDKVQPGNSKGSSHRPHNGAPRQGFKPRSNQPRRGRDEY